MEAVEGGITAYPERFALHGNCFELLLCLASPWRLNDPDWPWRSAVRNVCGQEECLCSCKLMSKQVQTRLWWPVTFYKKNGRVEIGPGF